MRMQGTSYNFKTHQNIDAKLLITYNKVTHQGKAEQPHTQFLMYGEQSLIVSCHHI